MNPVQMIFLVLTNAITNTCALCIQPRYYTAAATAVSASGINTCSGSISRRATSLCLKKSDVDGIALKIGLNVVPKATKTKEQGQGQGQDVDNNVKRKRSRKNASFHNEKEQLLQRDVAPTIAWGRNAKNFFWGGHDERSKPQPTSQEPQIVANKQEFPLFLLQNVLPPPYLSRALLLLTDDNTLSDAEEMEQHELVAGKPRALRRSLVSRLPDINTENKDSMDDDEHIHNANGYSRELLDMVVSGLPAELVKDMRFNSNENKEEGHPYEDGSVVY